MTANITSLFYATTNLSSVAFKSMLSMPTRFLNHIRRVDDVFSADIRAPQAELGRQAQQLNYSNVPGPWAFVTSGYAISLVIMVRTVCL